MKEIPNVILLLESARRIDRDLALGLAKYASLAGPWTFYREPDRGENPLQRLREWGAHGMIAHVPDKKTMQLIIDSKIPTITRGIKIPGFPVITSNATAVATMAAEHLIECGFQSFAFCDRIGTSWSQKRCEVFRHLVKKNGGDFYHYQAPTTKTKRLWENEQPILADWLQQLPKPIGIMADNDDRARHIIEAAKIAEVKIPDEVAIIGVDNDDQVCALAYPHLSSIALNFEQVGYRAAELLDLMMKGITVDDEEIILEPTHIVARQSTDVQAIEDSEVIDAIHFIRENTRKPIGVDNVVEATMLSRRVLEKRFRTTYDQSILSMIRKSRVEQICRMLIETNMTVSQIGNAMGFTSEKHISRTFRKEKEMSPIAYRNLYGKK